MDNWIEICIVDAIRTSGKCVERPGHKVYSEGEVEKWEGGDIDHMDIVLYWWLGSGSILDVRQRKIIFERLKGKKPKAWRGLCKQFNVSREKLRQEYGMSLKILEEWVVKQVWYDEIKVRNIVSRYN